MKQGVVIVNTSRGALVDTAAAVEALKTGKVEQLGLDVYQESPLSSSRAAPTRC